MERDDDSKRNHPALAQAAAARSVKVEGGAGLVLVEALGRARLARLQLRAIAEQRRAIGADDVVVRAHVEEHMRMVEGRLRADAHELARAEIDRRNPGVVVEMRDAEIGHSRAPRLEIAPHHSGAPGRGKSGRLRGGTTARRRAPPPPRRGRRPPTTSGSSRQARAPAGPPGKKAPPPPSRSPPRSARPPAP